MSEQQDQAESELRPGEVRDYCADGIRIRARKNPDGSVCATAVGVVIGGKDIPVKKKE